MTSTSPAPHRWYKDATSPLVGLVWCRDCGVEFDRLIATDLCPTAGSGLFDPEDPENSNTKQEDQS